MLKMSTPLCNRPQDIPLCSHAEILPVGVNIDCVFIIPSLICLAKITVDGAQCRNKAMVFVLFMGWYFIGCAHPSKLVQTEERVTQKAVDVGTMLIREHTR